MAIKESRGKIYSCDPADLTIVDDPKHPLFDRFSNDTPVKESLVESIIHLRQVVCPIQCMRDGERLYVVYGRSRLKACREANQRLIKMGEPVIKISYTIQRGERNSIGAMIAENEFRREIGTLERAEKVQALMNSGFSPDDCAKNFGVTIQTIGNWVALLDCCAAVRKAVEQGRITPTAAAKLSKLEVKEQEEKLEKLLDESTGKATVSKANKLAKKTTQETIFKKPTRGDLEAEIKNPNIPEDAKDVLKYVLGKAKKPWEDAPKVKEDEP